jgi:hypothetical protein
MIVLLIEMDIDKRLSEVNIIKLIDDTWIPFK